MAQNLIMGANLSESDLRAELTRCKNDYNYFRFMYLPVIDRDTSAAVRFKLRPAQRDILRTFAANGSSFILKFRRAGSTRVLLSRVLHRSLFNANVSSIIMMHEDASALDVFKQVREWYAGLPAWMKQGPLALQGNRSDELYFKHGGTLKVASARTAPVGGPTWWYRIYSEFAKYPDPERIIRLVEAGSAVHGRAVYETTAEGLGFAFEAWRSDNGWGKLFLRWDRDPDYKITPAQALALGFAFDELLWDDVVTYGRNYGLTQEQQAFVGFRLKGLGYNSANPEASWQGFHREFPITAELAFTTARGRVFKQHYPFAKPKRGYVQYCEPQAYRVYALGGDTSGGGEDGDFSAFCVLDVTDRDKPMEVATFYDHLSVPDYAEYVVRELNKWGALFIIERDPWGRAVLDRVIESGYGRIWRETYRDKTTGQIGEHLGRNASTASVAEVTATLQDYLNGGKLDPVDERVQYEINDFQWNEKGKAEAVRPNHDDMLRSYGLALKGCEQIAAIADQVMRRRPVTLSDKIALRTSANFDPRHAPQYEYDEFDLISGRATGLASISDLASQQR